MTKAANDAFVPLVVAPGASPRREDFRVLVAERPELARSLRELSAPAGSPPTNGSHAARCEPRVSLQKQADRVTGIHIECSCGQVIDLKCAYEDGKAEG